MKVFGMINDKIGLNFVMVEVDISILKNASGTFELNSAFSIGKMMIWKAIIPKTIKKMAVALER